MPKDKFAEFSEDVATATAPDPGVKETAGTSGTGALPDAGTPPVVSSEQSVPTEEDDFEFGKKPVTKPQESETSPKVDAEGKPIVPAEPPKVDAEGKAAVPAEPPPEGIPGIEIKSGEEGVKTGDEVLKDGKPMTDGKGTLTDGREVTIKDGKISEIADLPVTDVPDESVISLKPETTGIGKDGQVNWQDFGKTFELDLTDDKLETFTAGINTKIENARKETDLSEFTPEAQSFIKHLNENSGDMLSFIDHPGLRELNNFLEMSDVDKYTTVETEKKRTQGKDREEIEQEIEEELQSLNTLQLKGVIEKYDTHALGRKQEIIQQIVGEREEYISSRKTEDKEQTKEEKSSLKKLIDETIGFRGYPISQEVRTQMKSMVDSEDFLKVLNKDTAKAQLYAFLDIQFGEAIQKHIDTKLVSAGRSGFNKGVEKKTMDLHNIPPAGAPASGQIMANERRPETRFSSWTKELIEGNEGDSV